MRRAETNLALAARRPGKSEDILTEVLAGVLALDQDLARAVVGRLPGNPRIRNARIGVSTQRHFKDVGTPDMCLEFNHARYWVENKIDAIFQPDQLERYAQLGPGLVIVPTHRVGERPPDSRWTVLSWTEVAELATALLDNDHVSLKDAQSPTAEARHKARGDLIGYLEENGLTTPRALDDRDIAALASVSFVLGDAIPYILEVIQQTAISAGISAPEILLPGVVGGDKRVTREYDSGSAWCKAEPGSWTDAVGGWYDASLVGRPTFDNCPVLTVGMALETDRRLGAAQDVFWNGRWQNYLEKADFQLVNHEWGAQVIRVVRLAELPRTNLGEQANAAAQAFVVAVSDLRSFQQAWDQLVNDLARAAKDHR